MNKLIMLIALALVVSSSVNAKFIKEEAVETNLPVVTVEAAKTLSDDTNVMLKGNIVDKIKHEKYKFKDATGEIIVEIDDDDWKGVDVSSKDLVIIEGEVDKDKKSIEVDVDKVIKISK